MNNQTTYIVSAILLAAVIVAGAIIYGLNPDARGTGTAAVAGVPEESGVELEVTAQDHVIGNMAAPVTIVEYSDLQCSYCSVFHNTMLQMLEDYPGQIKWVYRHFPIYSRHPEAQAAAEAAECVAEQKGEEGFWQFVETAFANQEYLGSAFYREMAESLGLDLNQFDSCMSLETYKDKVEVDYNTGVQLGVDGTPASFVNGTLVKGAVPLEDFRLIIEEELSK